MVCKVTGPYNKLTEQTKPKTTVQSRKSKKSKNVLAKRQPVFTELKWHSVSVKAIIPTFNFAAFVQQI